MTKKIYREVEVSSVVRYLPENSNAMLNSYFFMYTISIENKSNEPVQLISRHWDIFDSNGEKKVVEGNGVVGDQPVIQPGEKFQYTSGCSLSTDIGKMSGYYNMIRLSDVKKIIVPIPEFYLSIPYRWN